MIAEKHCLEKTMSELQPKPTKEDRILRALEFLAADVQGVRVEFSWTVAPDRRACSDMLHTVCEAGKVQIAVQMPRACERLIGIPMPIPRAGLSVTCVVLRVLAPSDAFVKLRTDTAAVNSLRIELTDSNVPPQDNELRVMVGRGTFGCRIVT